MSITCIVYMNGIHFFFFCKTLPARRQDVGHGAKTGDLHLQHDCSAIKGTRPQQAGVDETWAKNASSWKKMHGKSGLGRES